MQIKQAKSSVNRKSSGKRAESHIKRQNEEYWFWTTWRREKQLGRAESSRRLVTGEFEEAGRAAVKQGRLEALILSRLGAFIRSPIHGMSTFRPINPRPIYWRTSDSAAAEPADKMTTSSEMDETDWSSAQLHCNKNIRISADILWRVFRILTEPVLYTFVHGNGSVKIWKTRHRMSADIRIFFRVRLANHKLIGWFMHRSRLRSSNIRENVTITTVPSLTITTLVHA